MSPDPAAEADAWKAKARKWEERSKANADAARRLAEFEERHQAELDATAERVRAEERRTAAERLNGEQERVVSLVPIPPAVDLR